VDAPVISKIMGSSDLKELEPRVSQSTIMFFDIRGFSRRTEGKNEKILAHLGDLKAVMTAMTDEILKENGVVLQYTGDGILACWNVPIADSLHVDRACRAALGMASRIGEVTDGWRCGIGLHTGEVVAGTIGSEQVFFYGVMGAVVNQASRVEGITKVLEVPVLATREVAERVSGEAAAALRLGRFQPAGMSTALDLYEISPPPLDAGRAELFAKGLEALEKGEWEKAYETLDRLPTKDLPARYLKSLAESYRRHPPKDWRGTIELAEK
jgi:adenylate cyclase